MKINAYITQTHHNKMKNIITSIMRTSHFSNIMMKIKAYICHQIPSRHATKNILV